MDLLAPSQLRYEVASAITAATLGREPRLPRDEARAAILEFLALGVREVSDDEILLDAHGLVHEYGCAYYDALYLALAIRHDARVVVADARFYRKVAEHPLVIWIGDYKGAASLP